MTSKDSKSFKDSKNFLELLINQARNPTKREIRLAYRSKPLEYFERVLGIVFPRKPYQIMGKDCLPGTRELVEDICTFRVKRAIMRANRGGGKSYGVACIDFFMWDVHDADCYAVGGSQKQSKKVYDLVKRFVYDSNRENDCEKILMEATQKKEVQGEKKEGALIACLPASDKSVRSPHVETYRIGVLNLDEEAEMESGIVEAARYIINTAKDSIITRTSTMHKAFGTFRDVWENADKYGYTRYEVDCFDVAEKCNRECKDCVPEFAFNTYFDKKEIKRIHISNGKRIDNNETVNMLEVYKDENGDSLRYELQDEAFCGGKAHYAEGFLRLDEIVQEFVESEDVEVFKINNLGREPSEGSSVIRKLNLLETCLVSGEEILKLLRELAGKKGLKGSIGIDWGLKSECAVVVLVEYNRKVWVVEYDFFTMVNERLIYGVIQEFARKYHLRKIFGDSSHPFCNLALGQAPYSFEVEEVNFGTQKDLGVGILNFFVENGIVRLSKEGKFEHLYNQLQGWRRDKHGKVVKLDDHGCDAFLCASLNWKSISGFLGQKRRTDYGRLRGRGEVGRKSITGGLVGKQW